MSVERQASRALRRTVTWRIVGRILDFPNIVFSTIATACNNMADFFGGISESVFYFELDAARRYKLLTGIDLGVAAGDEDLYAGMDAERNARMQADALGELDDEG